jgi:ribosomal protein L7Ae-like RNA K-turn-binding protein
MVEKDKVLSLLGLAKRAGRLGCGEFSVERGVKRGEAGVVIVAEDASFNTHKKFINMCTFYQVPCYLYGTKEGLGHALGKDIQASVAVLDDGFADAVVKLMNQAGVMPRVSDNVNDDVDGM